MIASKKFPTLFSCKRRISFGESLYLSGSIPELGLWNFENSLEMINIYEDIWYLIVSLPLNEKIEYKFIKSESSKRNSNNIKWDDGDNNIIKTENSINEENIKVMSFNIRYENPNDGKHSWEFRKNLVKSVILDNNPDILGIQESKPNQTNFLKENISQKYDFYGRGRDYNGDDECVGIFFNKFKYIQLDQGTFWLTQKRYEAGSILENAMFPRISSWVKLFCPFSNLIFWVFNTHFDHLSKTNRKTNMKILLDEIHNICKKYDNVIVMGDFNATDGEECIGLIKEKLSDTCNDSKAFTFHNFGFLDNLGGMIFAGKIDFIFIGKTFSCEEFQVIKQKEIKNNVTIYPSDHFPIISQLKINLLKEKIIKK